MTWRWPSWRLVAMAASAIVLTVAAAWSVGLWIGAQHREAAVVYAAALARLEVTRGQSAAEGRLAARQDLEAALARYPSAPMAAQAAYELGNLRYADRDYAGARAAYEVALARGASRSLRTLVRAGIGYSWEAERNLPKALEAFRAELTQLRPDDFQYEELLIDVARIQEQSGDKAGAIETYRRLLREVPRSLRADDVRSRLAALGTRP